MDRHHLHHEAKSAMAYMADKESLHIRLRTTQDTTDNVKLIYGDPFLYKKHPASDGHAWQPFEDGALMTKKYQTDGFDFFFIDVKPTFKRMKYAFLIDDRYLFGSREFIDLKQSPNLRYNLFNYFNFPYLNDEDRFKAPKWSEEQVWYSIFPARFNNKDASINPNNVKPWDSTDNVSNQDRFGGDLAGITEKLDYIKAMGYTGIYLNPIFHAGTEHKYDTIDYFEIDPSFGTKADLKNLVEQAHKRGIKIMLDAVFNHTGLEHPYFLDVVEKGKKSPYFNSFFVKDPDKPLLPVSLDELRKKDKKTLKKLFEHPENLNYETFAFTPFMPKINTMDETMQKHLLDVTTYWTKEFNIDGWRLDVSNEIPHAFWRRFRDLVKSINKDAYIVGENWDNATPWLMGDQYDAIMNYEILFPIWQYFGAHPDFESNDAHAFIKRINQVLTSYPDPVLKAMYNLVDSHDTARILTICDKDVRRAKLAYLFMFAFPGSPSVYYGGEIGLNGGHDPDNRKCMPWDEAKQNKDLQTFMKRLINLRKTYDAFKSVDFNWHLRPNRQLLMFEKENLLFIFNTQPQCASFSLPKDYINKDLKNVWFDKKITLGKSVTLDAYDFMILKR